MASNDPDEKCSNTKTGEETLALEKRRSKSRRVSFAETTAIHMFIRDEECETPPEEAEGSNNAWLHRSESDEIRELLADDDNEFNGTGDDDDGVAVETSFLRPFVSPNQSPGSFFGSATSNDEDDFFGPVSADFIKPGRLSNSAASDDIHDVTMDSTAFSMHFRSLARSDSGGEFKTPTGIRLAFGERASGQMSATPSGGDFMVLSASKKRGSGSLVSDRVDNSGNSDDMSIVGDNHHSYDYGKLPPELDVLLAKYGKDVGVASLTNQVECLKSNLSFNTDAGSDMHQNGFELLGTKNRDKVSHHVSHLTTFDSANSAVHVNIDNGNDGNFQATLGETTNTSNNRDDDSFPAILSDDKTTNPVILTNVMEIDENEEVRKGAMQAAVKFLSPISNSQPKLNHEQPLAGSVSSLLAKRRQIFSASSIDKSNLFVSEKKLWDQGSKLVLSASSFEKGVSKFKKLEAFPFVSASKAEGNASRLMSRESVTSSLAQNYVLKYGSKDVLEDHLAAPVACLDKQFSTVAKDEEQLQSIGKTDRFNMRTTLGDAKCASYKEGKDAEFTLQGTSRTTKFTTINDSPSELLKEKRLEPFVSTNNQKKEAVVSSRSDSSLLEITFSNLECNKETGMSNRSSFSPETSVERKVSTSPLYLGGLSKNVKHQNKLSFDLDRDIIQEADDANVGITNLSPSNFQRSGNHDENVQPSLKASNTYGSYNSSSLKRKLFDKTEDDNDELASVQHKLESCKDQKFYKGDNKVPHSVGGDATAREWVDVLKSFLGMIKLPPMIDNLDLAQIRTLSDILVHQEKLRSYELLHRHMCSQKAIDSASILQIKRLVDTKLLLYKMLYQRAKIQLMHLERDKLLDHVRQLDSKVEESEILTSSFQGSCTRGQNDVEVDCLQTTSCPIDLSSTSLAAADISSLRKDVEESQRKIRDLNKSYHAYINVMKEQSCTETTFDVKKFLRKRVACKSLQSEFQLCQVGSVKAMDGKLSVFFDHGGIVSQRFTVKLISSYGLFVSNVLNNVKISKMFLGMDACIAFSFVLCGETNLAYSGIQTIAQVTQKSSSLLHTLLDVVEEVELAMIELRNLTDTRFLQPSAGKLDLRLCFIDLNSGARVALSIDITCLNRGIYPSQAVPYEVQGKAAKSHKSFQILLEDIKSAVRGVRCGHMRIISLCRCVSRKIQANCMS